MSDTENALSISEDADVPPDARLPTAHGEFRISVFHEDGKNLDHVALTLGDMSGPDPVLVRIACGSAQQQILQGFPYSSADGPT